MDKFIIEGPTVLRGNVKLSGAKNVALKALVVSLLTDEQIVLHNIPDIRDVHLMQDVLSSLGSTAVYSNNTMRIDGSAAKKTVVPLEIGARLRTSSMVLGPMLARFGEALIPNPGGCRIGARPIDRHIDGLKSMGAQISYDSHDGFFHAVAPKGLHGARITFQKNTHTGTETLLLAAVLARGTTVLENAAREVEVDDLIQLLISMGARISRTAEREITIEGVPSLHGTEYTIMQDRNEEVTFAVAASVSHGSITVEGSRRDCISAFLEVYTKAGGKYEAIDDRTTRYYYDGPLHAVDVVTEPHPGFMTDWQAPWAILMTQAQGTSLIHETVFENRFTYVEELKKMGANIEYTDPIVGDPKLFYNFNWEDHAEGNHQAILIHGPTPLHNAVVSMNDLRAGATVALAAIIGEGQTILHGVEQIDRGYEKIDERLRQLGAHIERIQEDDMVS